MRLKDFSGVAAIQSGLMLMLVWLEGGRSFDWRDVAFAISCGLILTSLIFAIISITKRQVATGGLRLQIPSHFIPRFLFYWCAFMLVRAIPAADGYLLHPFNTERTTITTIFGWSAWMALVFAIFYWFSNRNAPVSSVAKPDPDASSEQKREP